LIQFLFYLKEHSFLSRLTLIKIIKEPTGNKINLIKEIFPCKNERKKKDFPSFQSRWVCLNTCNYFKSNNTIKIEHLFYSPCLNLSEFGSFELIKLRFASLSDVQSLKSQITEGPYFGIKDRCLMALINH